MQTDPLPLKVAGVSQTVFNYLEIEDEKVLFDVFKSIKDLGRELLEKERAKYLELQAIFESRPSRKEDRLKIYELSQTCFQLTHEIQELSIEMTSLRTVIEEN